VTDEIVLTLPDQRDYISVAHLVVGGLAVRLNLTFENLEDLQVALEGLLPRAEGEVTVGLRLNDGELVVVVGPFDGESLRAELEHGEDSEERVSLRRILDTVADSYEVVDRNGATWVELTKRVQSMDAEA
jgi:hypothetical protein